MCVFDIVPAGEGYLVQKQKIATMGTTPRLEENPLISHYYFINATLDIDWTRNVPYEWNFPHLRFDLMISWTGGDDFTPEPPGFNYYEGIFMKVWMSFKASPELLAVALMQLLSAP